jgi:DNA polymerase-3 subunit gamma/tau
MLKLLADSETSIRRSASPRLVVETLLLRWAMMDRAVDLAEVISGGRPDRRAGARAGSGAEPPPRPETALEASPARAPAPPPPAGPPDRLADLWEAIVTSVRERSRFLGEAASAVRPVSFEAPWITVELRDPGGLFARPLAEQAGAIEEVASVLVGSPVRLRVTTPEESPSVRAAPPRRMTDEAIRADRLKGLRARDPALDRAAEELDLEIVE